MQRLKLLWVDMTVAQMPAQLPAAAGLRCNVGRASRTQPLDVQMERARPDAVFFDFDYPDQSSLSIAAEAKQAHPSMPMFLLTVQHSEALAVWVFRSRFTDYLVKPVPQAEFLRCLDLLEEMSSEHRGQSRRRMAAPPIPVPEEVPPPSAAATSLLPAVYYIRKNFHTRIGSDEAAHLCGMSPFRFGRAFKEAFGMTFRDYVVRVRLQEANRLLQNPQASVTEVAYSVGFNDVSYFSRMFKRQFGVAPSAVQGTQLTVDSGDQTIINLPTLLLPHNEPAN